MHFVFIFRQLPFTRNYYGKFCEHAVIIQLELHPIAMSNMKNAPIPLFTVLCLDSGKLAAMHDCIQPPCLGPVQLPVAPAILPPSIQQAEKKHLPALLFFSKTNSCAVRSLPLQPRSFYAAKHTGKPLFALRARHNKEFNEYRLPDQETISLYRLTRMAQTAGTSLKRSGVMTLQSNSTGSQVCIGNKFAR